MEEAVERNVFYDSMRHPSILVIAGFRSGEYVGGGLETYPFWAMPELLGELVTATKGACQELGDLYGLEYLYIDEMFIQKDNDKCTPRIATGPTLTQEVAHAAFLRYFFPHSRVEVIDSCTQLGRMADPGYLDSFDLVVNYHPPLHALQLRGDAAKDDAVDCPGFDPIGPTKYLQLLRESRAFDCTSPYLNLNGDKSRIYRVLEGEGYPFLPYRHYRVLQ